MGLISSKLRSVSNQNGDKAIAYFCPGCERVHVVWHKGPVAWEWNGDVEAPTLSPSIRVYRPATVTETGTTPEVTECHCFVRNGQIEFLGDCEHALKGQTVPVPTWPYDPGTYGGIDE